MVSGFLRKASSSPCILMELLPYPTVSSSFCLPYFKAVLSAKGLCLFIRVGVVIGTIWQPVAGWSLLRGQQLRDCGELGPECQHCPSLSRCVPFLVADRRGCLDPSLGCGIRVQDASARLGEGQQDRSCQFVLPIRESNCSFTWWRSWDVLCSKATLKFWFSFVLLGRGSLCFPSNECRQTS